MRKCKLLAIMAIAMLSCACSNTQSTSTPDTTEQASEATGEETSEAGQDTTSNVAGYTIISDGEDACTYAEEYIDLPAGRISAARWDDMTLDFYLDLSMYYASNSYCHSATFNAMLAPEENMKTICSKNSEYLVDRGTYKDYEGNTHDAAFFLKNDNAYVLYNTEEYEGAEQQTKYTYAHLVNMMIWDELDFSSSSHEYIVKVPFPVYVMIDYYEAKECWSNNERWDKKHLFSLCSFDQAKEFYSMFSEGIASTDEKSKVIKVRGTITSKKTNESKPVFAVLDFKNKTYEIQYEDGSLYHSFESMNKDIENSYSSAGIINGKEVIYGSSIYALDVYVIENGKRRLLMDTDEMSDYLDSIPDWSCVGQSLELKLTNIKGNKYYFDVTATMKEDGEWTHNDRLVIKDKLRK